MLSLESFVRRILEDPWYPKARIERRLCGKCQHETDHEAVEQTYAADVLIGHPPRFFVRCLNCGRKGPVFDYSRTITIPRGPWPPPYVQASA